MTKITTKYREDLDATEIKVNGRFVDYAVRIESLEHISAGRWEGIASGEPFEIIGGRDSGGARNEWFVRWSIGYGDQYVPAKSAKQCISLIERV